MISNKNDGKTERFILRYNRFDIDIKSYKKAVEIFPNESYWSDKLELEEVKENYTKQQLKNPFTKALEELRTRYWVSKDNHKNFAELLNKLTVDQAHCDNLILVAMYYEVYKIEPIPHRKKLAKNVKQALELVDIMQEPGYELIRVSVKGGLPKSLKPKKYSNDSPISFNEQNFLRPMKELFIRWTKSSPDYWNLIGRHKYLEHLSESQTLAFKQDEILVWVYDYIADYQLSQNHHEACMKTGLILETFCDFIPQRKHYKEKLESKGAFRSYEDYMANDLRTKIQRALKKRDRTMRFKKEF